MNGPASFSCWDLYYFLLPSLHVAIQKAAKHFTALALVAQHQLKYAGLTRQCENTLQTLLSEGSSLRSVVILNNDEADPMMMDR